MLPVCAIAAWLVAGELIGDKPPLAKPKCGDITGVISPVENVRSIQLVSRATGKIHKPAAFDKKTGKFTFKGLVGDAAYDICAETTDGREIQGIDLEFTDARLLRMAARRREQLGLQAERSHELREADAKQLIKYVADLDDFLDIRRVLYIQGHGRRATLLVEAMRSRQFYAKKGDEIIWRIELWYFEYDFGQWQRVANQERLLRRERVSLEKWRKISVEYYPELSVFVSSAGKSKPVKFEIPDKPAPSRGRPAGTEIKLKTKPHILGVTVENKTESKSADELLIVPEEQSVD